MKKILIGKKDIQKCMLVLKRDNCHILLNSETLSSKEIWGGVGDEDLEKRLFLYGDGLIEHTEIIKYGQFQQQSGGDKQRIIEKRYEYDESINIVLSNYAYLDIIRDYLIKMKNS